MWSRSSSSKLRFTCPRRNSKNTKSASTGEASAAGQLIHPNIVTVFDVGHDDDDTPFIVMEYVEGKTLSEIMETEALSFRQAFQIAHDVLAGLAFAHAQGIVHRDVKPGNIIVTPDFRGKIMDFGIAHVVGSELTAEDDVLGSPYYMAPEQLAKGTIDRRTDLFSFAVVLYRMLTGALPFEGDSFAAIAQSILNDQPVPPDQRNPSITATLRSVILRCLEKKPDDRYDSAEEVDHALKSARLGTSGSAVTRRVAPERRSPQRPVGSRSPSLSSSARSSCSDSPPPVRKTRAPPTHRLRTSSIPNRHRPTAVEPDDPAPSDDEPPPSDIVPPPDIEPPQTVQADPKPPPPPPMPDPTTTVPPTTVPEVATPTMADLFYEARMCLERGELEESQAWLEELLLKDPSFEGASELLVEVTDRIWEEKLPLTFSARHNHRFGGCDGELNLTTLGVRYVSDDHDWAWSHEEIRVLERPDGETFFVETFEKDIIGLGKNKRYKFVLDGGLTAEDWIRYERVAR